MKMESGSIDLISKKQICTCSTLFCLSLPLFFTTTCRFVRLKPQTSYLHIFMEELPYALTKDFVSCVHVRLYFFTAAHFHLALAFLIFSPPL